LQPSAIAKPKDNAEYNDKNGTIFEERKAGKKTYQIHFKRYSFGGLKHL